MTEQQKDVLKQARDTYGNNNQILVCMEELNELACVLAKFPRYSDETKATKELHESVLSETADVYVILEHVKSIFGLSQEEIDDTIGRKVDRVKRWLTHSDSMQETIDDRTVGENTEPSDCTGCRRADAVDLQTHAEYCDYCLKEQKRTGKAPYNTSIES